MALKIRQQECWKCGGTGVLPSNEAGQQLRTLREKAGVSLRSISAELELSPGYLTDLELGRRRLSNELIERYQAALEKLSI